MQNLHKTLAHLQVGGSGVINSFTDQSLALKMIEIGCVPGETITLQHIAPLGCPFACEVNGTLISIRRSEAQAVLID